MMRRPAAGSVSFNKQRDEERQQQQWPKEDLQKLNWPLGHVQDSKGNVLVQLVPVGHFPDGIELPGLQRVIDGHRLAERLPQERRDYRLLLPPQLVCGDSRVPCTGKIVVSEPGKEGKQHAADGQQGAHQAEAAFLPVL